MSNQKVYTFDLELNWNLISKLSEIDRFGGSWSSIEKRESHSLKELKSMATVRSVGASTRIEGSKITDDEVEALIRNPDVSKLEERDQQEVAGYFEALDTITEFFRDFDVSENNIKQLHNVMMKHSSKDIWHRGNYKQHSNVVKAIHPDGSEYVVFQTTNPGFETEDSMSRLIAWYNADTETHPIIRSALFVYDFLSIHPFQDGNGRLSRLLTTLLLLRQSYSWIQYVSFEHEIESRKKEYYQVLMECQRQRPGENVYSWVMFFLDCLNNIQDLLLKKIEVKGIASGMTTREKKIFSFIENYPGTQSGEISGRMRIPLPTVKKILADMVTRRFIIKQGVGKGTNYTVGNVVTMKEDQFFQLTNQDRIKEFMLMNADAFVTIKRIVLTPLFEWTKPDDWSMKLAIQNLTIQVTITKSNGASSGSPYLISAYNTPYHYSPVFILRNPINIPGDISERSKANEYPIHTKIELKGALENLAFNVLCIYDANIE